MWKCSEEKTFLDFPYLQVVERQCRKDSTPETEEPHRFYVIRAKDWCNIIPITESGKVVLVKQFRAGVLAPTYEFPGGVMESSDADVQATALREMTEETGFEALPTARCEKLGSSYPNPALQDNQVHSLIVGPVKKTQLQNLDPAEDIEVVEVSVEELTRMLRNGEFTHALMLTTLFHFLMKQAETLDSVLQGLVSYRK
ncbi:MAG: NUDIX hydrolase [Cryobacterium sp.]|nr:NUDIX hydrolase [Oligoflexia bacterium]